MSSVFVDKNYDAYPQNYVRNLLKVTNGSPHAPVLIQKWHLLLSAITRHESFFTDFTKACDERCGDCSRCQRTKQIVTSNLTDPKSMHWEVWSKNPETGEVLDFVGILRLSNISPGCDATAHYFFFDGKLNDKTPLLRAWARWGFKDHPNWLGLERVTLEIPSHSYALARHAHKKLGFGGPFEYKTKKAKFPVEGVRENAVFWKDSWHDLLIMGRLKNGRTE